MAKKRLFDHISNAFSSRTTGTPPPTRARETDTIEGLRRENLRLTRALEELAMLNELAREIGASRNTDSIRSH